MNFVALLMLGRKWAWQVEERDLVRRIVGLCLALLGILSGEPGTTAQAQSTGSATYYLDRGVERYRAGEFESAIADFTQAIQVNSGFTKSRSNNLKSSTFSDKQKASVAADDRIVVADRFNAVAYYDRGVTWYATGEVDHAIDDLSKALGIDPRYTEAYLIRGRAWHAKRDLARAIADYDRAIALDPRSAFAYNNRGIARKDMQDVTEAISDFDRAILLDSGLVPAYINRGAARSDLGDLTGAMADLDHAVASDPRNAMAYNNRGTARQAAGDFSGALEDYNTAILLDSENALAYLNRGVFRLREGDIAGAESDFKRSLALDPSLTPNVERFLREGKRSSIER